jgi:transcriptional regulator with XRE-family HTH domain
MEDADIAGLALKIRRLVQERGWNQEEFARIARLNRHTARQILSQGPHRTLRNSTILACARAFGLSVSELRDHPLERLLPRMAHGATNADDPARRRHELATNPDLKGWIERNADRARQLDDDEFEELLALQDSLGAIGVEGFVQRIERRRKLLQRVEAVSATEYLDLLEQFVGLLFDKVKPKKEP